MRHACGRSGAAIWRRARKRLWRAFRHRGTARNDAAANAGHCGARVSPASFGRRRSRRSVAGVAARTAQSERLWPLERLVRLWDRIDQMDSRSEAEVEFIAYLLNRGTHFFATENTKDTEREGE